MSSGNSVRTRLRAARRALFDIECNIRWRLSVGRYCHYRVPGIGAKLSRIVDRTLLSAYGLDVYSHSIDIAQLAISHPCGILLGGNGIVSEGRVAVMSGVKFVGGSADDPEYVLRHRQRQVFRLGDNVMIGANSVVVGPVDICDNVWIAAMSLVNRSITEPGIYAGAPAKRIGDTIPGDEYVAHLPRPSVER